MADARKAQKLAAARKKLKEYQQKSSKPSKNLVDSDDNLGTCENLSSSTHSSINDNFDTCNVPFQSTHDKPQRSPFEEYFIEKQNTTSDPSLINFFDNLTLGETNDSLTSDNLNFQEVVDNQNALNYDNISKGGEPVINGILQENLDKFTIHNVNNDSALLDDKLKPSNIQQNDFGNRGVESAFVKVSGSSAESLRQLSSQISDLMNNDYADDTNIQAINRLENRNQELAALLDQEHLKSSTLQLQVQDFQNKITNLESALEKQKLDWDSRLVRELEPLQEQLQYYAQTNGILVGEKTELSMALSQQELICKQKTTDCEELQGRLKTSRSRVADLEKEMQVLKIERDNFQRNHTCKEENEELRKQYKELEQEREDINQDLLEVREKLNIKVNDNLVLQREVQDITHQLSLAQVKIQQITAGENLHVESQVEQLNQHNLTLEKQIAELNHSLKTMTEERDQASIQYQNYVQQLNEQVTLLASKLESTSAENDSLVVREKNLVKHIGELEKGLQTAQEERFNVNPNARSNNGTAKELEATLESIQNLQSEKDKLEANYQRVLSDKEDLLLEVESKKLVIEQLESQLDRLQDEQPDSKKLLADMESDKVAASMAVTQNSQLKLQLEEMQQAFVKMTNDKMELTEKLTSEEFHNRDIQEKLNVYTNQLRTLQDALIIKDNELQQMRTQSSQQNKQLLQQDQLNDRLRHYEAQYGSIQALQNELKDAQTKIEQLLLENEQLKESSQNVINVKNQTTVPQEVRKESESINSSLKNASEAIIHENASEDINHEDTSITINNENRQINKNLSSVNIDSIIIDKEVAMKRLEEKFTKMMQDIANLSEEKQRLEHIVTQLQGETETIGEYIALYQYQRGILKQRILEKDDQLRHLSEEREKVRHKIDILDSLVTKFVTNIGITPEMLQQHENLNGSELCSEHIKIRDEMTKVAESIKDTARVPNENSMAAEEIISLLAEIKSSNLIQPSDNNEDFNPCPWCSGQLLTI